MMFEITQSRVFAVATIFLLTMIIAMPILHELVPVATTPLVAQSPPISNPNGPYRSPRKMAQTIIDQPSRLNSANLKQELPSQEQRDNHGETMQKEQGHDVAVFATRIAEASPPQPLA